MHECSKSNRDVPALLRRRLLKRFALGGLAFLWPCRSLLGGPPPQSNHGGRTPAGPLSITTEQARESFQWLATLAAHQIPPVFEGEKDWGETKRVWAGVKLDLDGIKLKTHRRWRELRHGRWARYQLTLPDPDRHPIGSRAGLQVAIEGVEPLDEGRWRVHSTIRAPLQVDTRIERWNLGVQWYSIRVEGEVRVRLESTATVGFVVDYAEIPPALIVDPQMEQARLVLERLDVHRISKLGRDLAGNLGDATRSLIKETWLKKENERLAKRINAKIDRKRDSLRWSLWDFLSLTPTPSDDGATIPATAPPQTAGTTTNR